MAWFLGRLVGIMLDPGVFVPVLAAAYLLRRRAVVWQIALSSLAGILAAVVLAFATYSARRAYGDSLFNGLLPFYGVASFIWAGAFCLVIQAFSKRGQNVGRD